MIESFKLPLTPFPHRGPRVEQRAILTRTRYATTAARWRKPKSQEREIPHRAGSSKDANVSVELSGSRAVCFEQGR